MPEQIISWIKLKEELVNEEKSIRSCQCNYEKYSSWNRFDRADELQMINLGTIEQVRGSLATKEYPSRKNYWEVDCPMALGILSI